MRDRQRETESQAARQRQAGIQTAHRDTGRGRERGGDRLRDREGGSRVFERDRGQRGRRMSDGKEA